MINRNIDKKNGEIMNKKGEVTLFVILGIVIAAVVILLLYAARMTIFFPDNVENLNEVLNEMNNEIVECIGDIGNEPLIRIGLQGGYLNPDEDTYRLYNDTRISYLCYNIPGKEQCRNRMLLISDMENQLNDALKPRILSCVGNLNDFGRCKPIKIETPDELEIDAKINLKDVDGAVNYPVIIKSKKSENKAEQDRFVKKFNYPLGDLYNVMHDVIDFETDNGEFDPLFYMIAKKNEYKIYKNRPYPDKLYAVKRTDNDYLFQFFVESEPG